MRKFLSLILVVMVSLLITASANAEVVFTRGIDSRVLTDFIEAKANLNCTLSDAGVRNRILGFSYSDSGAGGAFLADIASAAGTVANNLLIQAARFAEIYVAAGGTNTLMFPLPRDVTNGVVVGIGTTTGAVIIYYE